jgi:hypothetical protein
LWGSNRSNPQGQPCSVRIEPGKARCRFSTGRRCDTPIVKHGITVKTNYPESGTETGSNAGIRGRWTTRRARRNLEGKCRRRPGRRENAAAVSGFAEPFPGGIPAREA